MNAIDLVELGYVPYPSELAWRQAMMLPITRYLDRTGVRQRTYSLGPQGPADAYGSEGDEKEVTAAVGAEWQRYSLAERQAMIEAVRAPGIESTLQLLGRLPETDEAEKVGFADAPFVVIHPLAHPPAVFTVLSRTRTRIDRSGRALWRKLAGHLSAGCRLSGRPSNPDSSEVDCVLTPDGDIAHAQGAACEGARREYLRTAVRDMERARTRRGRTAPHVALEMWKGLYLGQWSLVDHFDSDGRRYLLARRNSGPGRTGGPLQRRQAQVLFHVAAGLSNKEVAHKLGISESTVGTHLSRALQAIGLRSRIDWIRASATFDSVLDSLNAALPHTPQCVETRTAQHHAAFR